WPSAYAGTHIVCPAPSPAWLALGRQGIVVFPAGDWGATPRFINLHPGPWDELSASPSGKTLLLTQHRCIHVWPLESRLELAQPLPADPSRIKRNRKVADARAHSFTSVEPPSPWVGLRRRAPGSDVLGSQLERAASADDDAVRAAA